MSRPSILTDDQWAEIAKRALFGESLRALAKEFKITYSTLHAHISDQNKKVKQIANQMVEVDTKLSALPISGKLLTLDLAASLRSISNHLAQAANNGAATAHRLSGFAHSYSDMIDDNAPLAVNKEALDAINEFQNTANEAAKIGINLLAANKENAKLNVLDVDPDKISNDPIEASRAYQRMLGT